MQRIPSDVLNLAVADARDVAEVERSQRCALTVVGNCHEAVVGRAHRRAVERNPAEVDRLRDNHLKVLRSLYSLKVGVPHIVAQTIDIAIGLVGVEQAHAAPVGAVGTHGNEPLRSGCGAKHDCHQAENSFLHNYLLLVVIGIICFRTSKVWFSFQKSRHNKSFFILALARDYTKSANKDASIDKMTYLLQTKGREA